MLDFLAQEQTGFWDGGYLEITLGVILAALLLLYLALMLMNYRQVLVPEPFQRNTVSSNLSIIDIAQQYLIYKGINDVGVSVETQVIHPFNNYHNSTITLNNLPISRSVHKLSGMSLDYVLGRLFLSVQQHFKERDYQLYRWLIIFLPVIILYLFVLFFILNLVIACLWIGNQELITSTTFFYHLFQYRICMVLMIVLWLAYFGIGFLNAKIKLNIENDYEEDIAKFVKKNYLDLYSDFVIARRFSRSLKTTYSLGINWILKRNYRYTGPFGYL